MAKRRKGDPTRVDPGIARQALDEARIKTASPSGQRQWGWTLYIVAGFNAKRNPWPLGNMADFDEWCKQEQEPTDAEPTRLQP